MRFFYRVHYEQSFRNPGRRRNTDVAPAVHFKTNAMNGI